MKIKILRSTEALDEGTELDDLVNRFIREVAAEVYDVQMSVDEGEVYVMIKYDDIKYATPEDDCYNCHCAYEDCCQTDCADSCSDDTGEQISLEEYMKNEGIS